MNIKDPLRVLDEISQDHVPQDVDLMPGILAQIQEGSGNSMKPKTRQVVTILLIVCLLVVLFFSLPGVVSAMQKMLGYIPGVGIVNQSAPLRVLAKPVVDVREGFTTTIDNALLDSEHTVISYKVTGAFLAQKPGPNGEPPAICSQSPELHLPDGSVLAGGSSDEVSTLTGFSWQFSFPAIPANVNTASLFFPCVEFMLFGQGPQNWEIPLRFVPAPPEMTVYPVIDYTTPTSPEMGTETSTPSVSSGSVTGSPTPEADASTKRGIELRMESVVPLKDGYLLQARLDGRANPDVHTITVKPQDVKVLDASGQEIAFETNDDQHDANEGTPLSYQTAGIYTTGPAHLVVDAADVGYATSVTFSFEPGKNPQPGQVWQLNKDLQVDGHQLRILTATETSINAGELGLDFEMQSSDGISYATITDTEHPTLGGGGNGADLTGLFSNGFTYANGLPQGPLTLTVTEITSRWDGPWSVEWTPTMHHDITPTPPAPACLTVASWEAALASPRPIPAGLTGKLVYAISDPQSGVSRLFVARLDGSDSQSIADSNSASLSPDGNQLVYADADGLVLYSMANQIGQHIPGTQPNDTGPLWSPDGLQIAFGRDQEGAVGTIIKIFVVKPDGSGLRPVLVGNESENLAGWMPDANHILYTIPGDTGSTVRLFDLQGGASHALFGLRDSYPVLAISPDGTHLAFAETQFGYKQALVVSTLDGSGRQELFNTAFAITNLRWSPDGNWLLLNFVETNVPNKINTALLHVAGCQIIPLEIKGAFFDWVP